MSARVVMDSTPLEPLPKKPVVDKLAHSMKSRVWVIQQAQGRPAFLSRSRFDWPVTTQFERDTKGTRLFEQPVVGVPGFGLKAKLSMPGSTLEAWSLIT
jgi:hypothetical protein